MFFILDYYFCVWSSIQSYIINNWFTKNRLNERKKGNVLRIQPAKNIFAIFYVCENITHLMWFFLLQIFIILKTFFLFLFFAYFSFLLSLVYFFWLFDINVKVSAWYYLIVCSIHVSICTMRQKYNKISCDTWASSYFIKRSISSSNKKKYKRKPSGVYLFHIFHHLPMSWAV